MQTRNTWFPAAGLTALLLAGCTGGGSDPNSLQGTSGDFLVLRTTPANNGKLFLNEPIAIDFSNPVDLSSADLNTFAFQVFDLNGNPLNEQPAGAFTVGVSPGQDSTLTRRLLFSPRFPTNDTYDDGGFKPGRIYIVQLVGGDQRNGTVLRDTNGRPLAQPVSFEFTTADGTTPSQLFSDTRPGGPRQAGFSALPSDNGGVALSKFGDSRVEIRLSFDQPLNPASTNVPTRVSANPLNRSVADRGRIFLEYDDTQGRNTWIPATVDLEVNTRLGSEVVLRPVGILPNNAEIRVIVENTVEDMSGESNVSDASFDRVFATFRTRRDFEPQYDAVIETFDADNAVDLTASFLEPVATVRDGGVTASFEFEGGESRLSYRPNSREIVLNTDFTQITPQNSPPINVSGGVFNFADVEIPEGVEVSGIGTNPMVWLVTGDFTVNGTLKVDGGRGQRVDSLNSANAPTPGGIGTAGGGNGGRGSPNGSDRSQSGEPGFGPGQQPALGGEPGRLSCVGTCNRGSAGGGGSMGTQGDPYYPPQQNPNLWPQVGGQGGEGCLNKSLPGGGPGPRPFTDSRQDNDFWGVGVNVFEEIRVQGELLAPIAGTGGGGGGDRSPRCNQNDPGFISDNKGGGGGGGAGILIIKCLGKVTVGPKGLISANGGDGGGGEQAGGNNEGGGGGGGSGGMVIIQAGQGMDIWVHGDELNGPKSTYGEQDYSFAISADGGIGTQGRFGGREIASKYPPGNDTWNQKPTGGFGGLGIVQLMMPPGDDQVDNTGNRLDDNINFLYRDSQGIVTAVDGPRKVQLLGWKGWPDASGVPRDDDGNEIQFGFGAGELAPGDIRPTPVMLPSPFGSVSRVRSRWVDLGFAVRQRVDQRPGPDVPRVVVARDGEEPRPDFAFAGTSSNSDDAGYATFTSTGQRSVPVVRFGSETTFTIASTNTAVEHEGQPAYLVEVNGDLGEIDDRYAGYRLQLLNDSNAPAGDFRILAHNNRFIWVLPEGAFPTGASSARVIAKFFEVTVDGQAGLGPTYTVNQAGDQAPVANVRVGFAFHTDPTQGRGTQRWPNGTSANDPLYEYDLTNPDFLQWLDTNRPAFVQWDVVFNTRYHPSFANNNSGEPLNADLPLPRLEYLVIPYRF